MPSRSSFNTGLYPHACGVLHNPVVLHQRFQTLAEILGAAGYRTGGFGHLGGDGLERGFDEKVDLVDPPIRDAYLREQRAVRSLGSSHSSALCGVHPFPEEEVQDTVATELALDFIDRASSPFYLQLSFMDPHIPLLVPQRFVDLYDLDDVPLPPTWRDELAGKPANVAGTRRATRTENIPEGALRDAVRHYRAATSFVDALIGRILDRIEPLARETVVIFIADHGDYAGEFGMVGKTGNFYDCLTRVPWIMRGPESLVSPGSVIDGPAGLVDIVPTVCELCEIEAPRAVQGTSRAGDVVGRPVRLPAGRCSGRYAFAATRGHVGPGEDAVPTEGGWPEERLQPLPTDPYSSGPVSHVYDGTMVRSERHKLSIYGDGFMELYDLQDDPWETRNLAGLPEHQSTLVPLLSALTRWQMETWPLETRQSPLPYHYRATAADLIPETFREAHGAWQAETGIRDPE
jgi:arylsulfatase A-like enzyme